MTFDGGAKLTFGEDTRTFGEDTEVKTFGESREKKW